MLPMDSTAHHHGHFKLFQINGDAQIFSDASELENDGKFGLKLLTAYPRSRFEAQKSIMIN